MNSLTLSFEELRCIVLELDYSPASTSVSGEDIWTALFSKSLEVNIHSERIKVIKFLTNKYQKAVLEARKNRVNVSLQFFKEAEQVDINLSNEEINLVKIFALPAKAYLLYKQSQYSDAINATNEAMLIDEDLEDLGFSILHYHRIQQLQNICRIYFRMNKLDEAIRSCNELLRYLITGQTPYLFKGKWSVNLFELAPYDLRSAMIFQILKETHSTCMNLSKNNFDKQKRFHTEIFDGLNNFEKYTKNDETMENWLAAMSQFYCRDYDKFIKTSLDFLRYETNQFDHFKYFLVKDILHVFSEVKETYELSPIWESLNTYAEVKLKKKKVFSPTDIG